MSEARSRRPRVAFGAAAVAVAVLGAGTAYALWGDTASQAGGIITAGDLSIELLDTNGAAAGTASWVDDSCAPGETIDPATRLAVPGDTFTITQGFRTLLEGDNLAGRVTVSWDPAWVPANLPTGVTGTYVLSGGSLTAPTSPTALGTSITVPGSPNNIPTGTDDTWTVTITLDYSDTAPDRVVLPGQLAAEPTQFAELGTIVLRLDQVRDGTGFTS